MLPPNLHDLGGLPLIGGGVTAPRRIWRSGMEPDAAHIVWDELAGLGVRTVVDLRKSARADRRYRSLWPRSRRGGSLGEPDFFAWGMTRWPALWDAAFGAIADAAPGGVLIHCAAGRDRTGFVSAVLLNAAGVARAAILDDYRRGVRESRYRNIDELVAEYAARLDRVLDTPLTAPRAGLIETAARRLR